MKEEVEAFKRLLETTRWSSVAPQGKAYAIEFLGRLRAECSGEEWTAIAGTVAERFGEDANAIRGLVEATTEVVIEFFSRPPQYAKDWIDTYLAYTSNHEAPEQFHFWTACSVLSAASRRRVYFDQNYYKIFPNLFTVLVAPAGRCRRSVATNIGMRILRASGTIPVLSEKVTPEGLAVALHAVGQGDPPSPAALIIHAPELSVFLGRQQYNEGLIALLTTLYDCPEAWEYITRTKSEVRLKNVYLCMLGATAPDWLADSIPPVAFGGGFLSRTLIIAANKTDRVFPFPLPNDPSLEVQLTDRLRGIAARQGTVKFSDEAKKWYIDWYDKARSKPVEPGLIGGYFERKQDHLIRVATILRLSQDSEAELVLTVPTLERALRALEGIEPSLPLAFKDIGTTDEGRFQELVRWHLVRHGGTVNHTPLLQAFVGRASSTTVTQALYALVDAGMVVENGRKNERDHSWTLTDAGWAGPSY